MDSVPSRTLQQRLIGHGIVPTLQRMAVAQVLLARPVHMTAEQVLEASRGGLPSLSRTTVYDTLQLFVTRGLLRELPIDGVATVYDSNTRGHHHFYDVDTGEVADVPEGLVQVQGVEQALDGLALDGVDVIVRVRGLSQQGRAPMK